MFFKPDNISKVKNKNPIVKIYNNPSEHLFQVVNLQLTRLINRDFISMRKYSQVDKGLILQVNVEADKIIIWKGEEK